AHVSQDGLELFDAEIDAVAGDRFELVERAARVAEAAARHLGHDHAARRGERRQHDGDLVADAAGTVLADLDAGNVREIDAVARVDHRGGEPRRFVDGHAAQHDGHQQRRRLVVREGPASHAVDEEIDLLARQRAAVTLFGDYVDDAHEAGILFNNRSRQMTQATLSPELTRQSIALARALSAAARNWGLYPPEHPAAVASLTRLSETIGKTVAGAAFTFGVTPTTLL